MQFGTTAEGIDSYFMQQALSAAAEAAGYGEVPVGAVVVRDGEILGRAHNSPVSLVDPTAHAEVLALRQAATATGNYRLPGTTVFVTVEPCMMCVGALLHARVDRVVYGCAEPKGGAMSAVYELAESLGVNHRFAVTAGVHADEARAILQRFFRLRRGA